MFNGSLCECFNVEQTNLTICTTGRDKSNCSYINCKLDVTYSVREAQQTFRFSSFVAFYARWESINGFFQPDLTRTIFKQMFA